MKNVFRKGDRVVCRVKESVCVNNVSYSVYEHDVLTVRSVRIYPNIGFCVSFDEMREGDFYLAMDFGMPDLKFAHDLLKSIKISLN